jgi:hypothetical protein
MIIHTISMPLSCNDSLLISFELKMLITISDSISAGIIVESLRLQFRDNLIMKLFKNHSQQMNRIEV